MYVLSLDYAKPKLVKIHTKLSDLFDTFGYINRLCHTNVDISLICKAAQCTLVGKIVNNETRHPKPQPQFQFSSFLQCVHFETFSSHSHQGEVLLLSYSVHSSSKTSTELFT